MDRNGALGVVILVVVIMVAPWLPMPGLNAGFAPLRAPRPEATATAIATPTAKFAGDDVSIQRDAQGRFHIDVEIDGHTLPMLVDTGADTVALTEADAQTLGLAIDPDSFAPIVSTASGKGLAARVHIGALRIAGQDIDGITAVVVRGLDTSLLGQSVLRRLGTVSINGDTMTIAH